MARFIADLNGKLIEVKPLSEATVPYATSDATTTARDNSVDANKMIELDSTGTIDKDFLPYRFITQGGSPGHAGMSAILDSNGKWDISLMPDGVGAEVSLLPAFEALSAGNFCNIFLDTGVGKARKADNSTSAKSAHGFVLAAFGSGATATIYGISNKNHQLSGLTIGADYWLGTGGGVSATSPTANNSWVQHLGVAETATRMVFSNVSLGWTKTV